MYPNHKRSVAAFVGGLLLAAPPPATADQKSETPPSAPPVSEKAPPPAQAQALIDAAVSTAKVSGRTVLVHFGASW